jgi:hypothetical protein
MRPSADCSADGRRGSVNLPEERFVVRKLLAILREVA